MHREDPMSNLRLMAAHGAKVFRRGESGQSLIEFAVMGVVLIMLLQGVLDLGRAYFTYLALKDAAADGAYFGAAFPRCLDGAGGDSRDNSLAGCVNPNNIDYRTRKSAPSGGLVDWTTAAVTTTYSDPTNYVPGSLVTVTVSSNYRLLTPLVGAIAGTQDLPLYAQSVGVIVSNALP